jgi:hypothetical protein
LLKLHALEELQRVFGNQMFSEQIIRRKKTYPPLRPSPLLVWFRPNSGRAQSVCAYASSFLAQKIDKGISDSDFQRSRLLGAGTP